MSFENERILLDDMYNLITEKSLSIKTTTVSNENIFSVLDIINKEVPYCKVLLHLIKNNWKSFENLVLGNCCKGEDFISAETEYQCEAPCEFYDKEGRIDIFIKTENHVVVIEAKVDAGDQEHQLVRYKKELEKEQFKNFEKHIFYLTVDKTRPSENSLCCNKCMSKNNNHKMCELKEYKCISFNDEIYNWLNQLVSEYEEYSIAKDFLEVLELERNNNKEFVELLKESAEYPKLVRNLWEVIPILWTEIRSTFFDAIVKELKSTYNFEITSGEKFYNREVWEVNLIKNKEPLHFCYETNFFLRTGIEDNQWKYINSSVFTDLDPNKDYSTRKSRDAFNVKYFSNSSIMLLDWFYLEDIEMKNQIIKNIASTANRFFEEKHI